MKFIVMRAGQVTHETPLVPAARPARVGFPAVQGVGDDEHFGVNHEDGWVVEVDSLENLLQLVLDVEAQVSIRAPKNILLDDKPAWVLDLVPGIGQ